MIWPAWPSDPVLDAYLHRHQWDLMSVTPIVSQLIGGGKHHKISGTVTQALYLSVLLAITVVLAGILFLEPLLSLMNLNPAVQHIAKHYLIGLSIGIIPLFAANVLRYFFDSRGHTRIMMMIMLFAVPFNIGLSYLLIFGKFGFPQLGGIGSGYASGITYWLIFTIAVVITFKVDVMRKYALFVRWFAPSVKAWKDQLAIGIPMGLSVFFESSIFAVVTLMMEMMFNTVIVAAHQAAINFTSLLFMIPLSISMALTIVVGFEVGAKRFADAKRIQSLWCALGHGFNRLRLGFPLFFPRMDRRLLYGSSGSDHLGETVLDLRDFLPAFRCCSQASLQGVLRGYKDVTVPFITAFISYWGIGMPVGYGLAAFTHLGPFGFWLGITIGLTCAFLGFWIRLLIIQKRFAPHLPEQKDPSVA